VQNLAVSRTASTDFNVLRCPSDSGGSNNVAFTGGGADYEDYFEWADGNPSGEDRRAVALDQAAAGVRQH